MKIAVEKKQATKRQTDIKYEKGEKKPIAECHCCRSQFEKKETKETSNKATKRQTDIKYEKGEKKT